MHNGNQLEGKIADDSIILFAADNVDHNVCTLDGKNTFHGMGIIAAIKKGTFNPQSLPRRTVTNEEILTASEIEIIRYGQMHKKPINYVCQVLDDESSELSKRDNIEVLYKSSLSSTNPIPSWSGFMQLAYDKQPKENCETSNVFFLPIIDMSSSDMSCIYSTLNYVSQIAYKFNKPTVITFDQPLFWKASMIVKESKDNLIQNIVVMLGTFHTIMNLLGCIGYIMENSGLSDLLTLVYGENAVKHMLSGKAVSRALRGNLLIDLILNNMIIDILVENSEENLMLQQANDTYDLLLSGSISPNEIQSNPVLTAFNERIMQLRGSFKASSRTAKLWLEYQSVVFIVRSLIVADRLGNWDLHIAALKSALPVFAACGHFNYTKSVYLYVNEMEKLQERNVDVYRMFKDGHFVVRRTNRNWSGLPTDLIIEQVLMRSLKTTGGLTRGTG